MRSLDDGMTTTATLVDEPSAEPRLPGGKALARLLHLLDQRGLTELEAEAVAAAVPDEAVSTVLRMAAEAGSIAEAPSRRRRRKRAADTVADADTDAADLSAVDFAQIVHDTADRTGPPTPTGPRWRSLGPWTVRNGQTYGSTRIDVSGRVSALAVDPARPTHVLAGAAHGGVWESFDRGTSWSPRTDYETTLTVGALAFDPGNSSIAYCGTGEGDWWSWFGNGVLRSTNGGSDWDPVCTAPFVGQGFYALTVDPANGQRLLAGATGGLWTSVDGGVTWTNRRRATCWAIARAASGGEILAGCQDGLFRSTDGGVTWTAVALPGAPATFTRLAVSRPQVSADVAYAFGAAGGTATLWRREGTTWTAIGTPTDLAVGQAWYDWYVSAAPDSAGQVYLGAIDVHRGDRGRGGAWTWQNLSSRSSGVSIHPDQHSMAFEPGAPATVYAGGDGGVYRSPDRGATWVSCNNGLEITEFEYIAHDLGTSRLVLGGTQDNGTNLWTGANRWEHVGDADGGDCGVNRTTPTTMIHSRQNGTILRSTTGGALGSWGFITPPRPAGEGPGLFYVPIECSATNGDTLAVGGLALYVSRDNGTSWRRLDYGTAGTASATYVPDADTVIVGLTDGRVLRSRWTAGAWTALAALTTARAGAAVSDLHATAGGGGRLWLTSSRLGGGRVWRSDDGGTTWTDQTAGLPSVAMNAVIVDPANANRIWVAGDLGVYQSRDSGATWTDFASGLPNCFIGDLVFHQHARVLRAGTRNRGVWEIPVDGWMTRPQCGRQWTGTVPARQSKRWFTFNWPATWHIVWTVMPTTVAPGAPQLSWKVQVERASAEFVTYWITVQNKTAAPVDFEGRYCILNRY